METKRRSREKWTALLDEMSKSGLTQTEWCRQNNINYKMMRSMKDKVQKTAAPLGEERDKSTKPAPASGFVRVVARKDLSASAPAQQPIELRMGALSITIAYVP
jgi:hypothetical protein